MKMNKIDFSGENALAGRNGWFVSPLASIVLKIFIFHYWRLEFVCVCLIFRW